MSKVVLPTWRQDPINSALDEISSFHLLDIATPEVGDSDEVLRIKRNMREALKRNGQIIVERIELALNPKARRSATGYPYIPQD